jgi:hypothetical protein
MESNRRFVLPRARRACLRKTPNPGAAATASSQKRRRNVSGVRQSSLTESRCGTNTVANSHCIDPTVNLANMVKAENSAVSAAPAAVLLAFFLLSQPGLAPDCFGSRLIVDSGYAQLQAETPAIDRAGLQPADFSAAAEWPNRKTRNTSAFDLSPAGYGDHVSFASIRAPPRLS